MIKFEDLLIEMVERKASDLFLKAGSSPTSGSTAASSKWSSATVAAGHRAVCAEHHDRCAVAHLRELPEMDLAIGVSGIGRFRVNVFRQRGTIGLVLRHISNPEFSFKDLNLPDVVEILAAKLAAMVLVTGMTGSGKSTTWRR